MSFSSAPASSVKVPVGPATRAAYRTVFRRLGLIFELGWIPILGLLATILLPGLYLNASFKTDDVSPIGLVGIAQGIVAVLCVSAFAVRWCQAILVGDPRRLPPRLFFRAWARFLLYMFAFYLVLFVLIAAALVAAGSVPTNANGAVEAAIETAGVAIGVLVFLGLARCSLVFPAAASDKPISIVAGWRLMRGNAWRLTAASFMAFLPIMLVGGIIVLGVLGAVLPAGAETITAAPPGLVIVVAIVETMMDFLLAALGATILATFYRSLVEPPRS